MGGLGDDYGVVKELVNKRFECYPEPSIPYFFLYPLSSSYSILAIAIW